MGEGLESLCLYKLKDVVEESIFTGHVIYLWNDFSHIYEDNAVTSSLSWIK